MLGCLIATAATAAAPTAAGYQSMAPTGQWFGLTFTGQSPAFEATRADLR